jgi:hypothetical protein
MKKIIIVLTAVIALACSGDNREKSAGSLNSEENVDENSGESISPQLKDSADRLEVDTVSSASGAQEQKDNELNK